MSGTLKHARIPVGSNDPLADVNFDHWKDGHKGETPGAIPFVGADLYFTEDAKLSWVPVYGALNIGLPKDVNFGGTVALSISGDGTLGAQPVIVLSGPQQSVAIDFNTFRGTLLAPTGSQAGDTIAILDFNAVASNDEVGDTAARITALVDTAPGVGFVPGRIEMWTTDAAGDFTERLRIDSHGNISFGDPATAKFFWSSEAVGNVPGNALYVGTSPAELSSGFLNYTGFGGIYAYDPSGEPLNLIGVGGIQQNFFTSRGTLAAPATVIDNDILGELLFYGFDGSVWRQVGEIDVIVDGAPGVTVPTRIELHTTDATIGTRERLRINSLGNVSFGDPATALFKWQQDNPFAPVFLVGPDPATTLGHPCDGVGRMNITSDDSDVGGVVKVVFTDIASGPEFGIDFVAATGTLASPQAVASNSKIVAIDFWGYDGTQCTKAAGIQVRMDGSISNGVVPGRLEFQTAASDDGTVFERLRIDSLGGIILNDEFANGTDPAAPAAGARLYVVKDEADNDQLTARYPSGDPIALGLFQKKVITLTNAQIKALPTTSIEIIPAPGANKVICAPIVTTGAALASLFLHWAADYTNINTNLALKFKLGTSGVSVQFLSIISKALLVTGGLNFLFVPSQGDIDSTSISNDPDTRVNKAISLSIDNMGSGDLTGGDAANTLTVTVYYTIIDV